MSDNDNVVPMPASQQPEMPGRQMTPWEQFWNGLRIKAIRLRRKLPHLVWHGDEIDVRVTLATESLTATDLGGAYHQFTGSQLREIEGHLRDLGITFDTGLGPDGRDWEWDYSLSGPISVAFKGRAKNPERRMSQQTAAAMASALAAVQAKP
jgi:hypothetical protein